MNPERPNFVPNEAEEFFNSEPEDLEFIPPEIAKKRTNIIASGEIGFDPLLGEEVGTRNAWVRAGFPSIRNQMERSDLEPIVLHPHGELTARLWSRSQIEEVLKQRDERMEGSQRPEGLRHPETGQRLHSIAGWAREYGFDRKTLTKMLAAIEAKATFTSKINNGIELPLYEQHAILAAFYNYQFSFIGSEQVEADPFTGEVIGSKTAWANFLQFSGPSVITRRVNNDEFVRLSSNRHKSKLYSAQIIQNRFVNEFEQLPELSTKLDQLLSLAIDLNSSDTLEYVQGVLSSDDLPMRLADPLERSDKKRIALAWVKSPEHWRGRVLANVTHRDQIIQLEEGKMIRVGIAQEPVQDFVSILGVVNEDGLGRLRDGTPVKTIEAWSKKTMISNRKMRLAIAEGIVRPYYLPIKTVDGEFRKVAVFTQAHINAIEGLSDKNTIHSFYIDK